MIIEAKKSPLIKRARNKLYAWRNIKFWS